MPLNFYLIYPICPLPPPTLCRLEKKNNPWRPTHTSQTSMGGRPCTGTWWTYQWLQSHTLHAELLTGLLLCRSYISNQKCCEFMLVAVLQCQKDTSLTAGSFCYLFCDGHEPCGEYVFCRDVPFVAEYSTDTTSQPLICDEFLH